MSIAEILLMKPLDDPRQVSPSAVRKWVVQAFGLLGRGALLWILMMAIVCCLLYAAQPYFFVVELITVLTYFIGIGIAALVDGARRPALNDVAGLLLRHHRAMLHMILVVIGLATIIQLLFGAFAGQTGVFSRIYDLDTPFSLALFAQAPLFASRQWFGASLGFFCLGILMTSVPFATSFLQYHCMVFLNLPWGNAYQTADEAMEINLPPLMIVSAILTVTPLILLVAAPFFAPLLYCFAPAFSYVIFRDIYLGIDKNGTLETRNIFNN